jgi:hypothetical protein
MYGLSWSERVTPGGGLGASRELGPYEEPWEGRERCRDGRCGEHGAVEGVHRRAPFGSSLEWQGGEHVLRR